MAYFLVFKVSEKWNYFHPAYRTPGTDLQLAWRGTTPDRSLTTWKIRFDSSGYAKGTASLDIALASSVFGSLKVALNGVDIASFDTLPGPPGDNASYRVASRGMYRQLPPIAFQASDIKAGENVITLSPVRAPKAPTSDNWMEPVAGIMYDVIRLQVDESPATTPVGGPTGGTLAVTGQPVELIAGVGAGLVAAGAALHLAARRRRASSTAEQA